MSIEPKLVYKWLKKTRNKMGRKIWKVEHRERKKDLIYETLKEIPRGRPVNEKVKKQQTFTKTE